MRKVLRFDTSLKIIINLGTFSEKRYKIMNNFIIPPFQYTFSSNDPTLEIPKSASRRRAERRLWIGSGLLVWEDSKPPCPICSPRWLPPPCPISRFPTSETLISKTDVSHFQKFPPKMNEWIFPLVFQLVGCVSPLYPIICQSFHF